MANFYHDCRGRKTEHRLSLRLSRRLFPYMPCDRELIITRLALMFETRETREQVCCKKEYMCCDEHSPGAKSCRCPGRHERHCEAYACRDCEASCCCECVPGCQTVEFTPHEDHDERADGECECEEIEVRCMATAKWPGLYHGVLDTQIGPLAHSGRPGRVTFEFSHHTAEVSRVFLLCRCEVVPICNDTEHVSFRDAAGWVGGRGEREARGRDRGVSDLGHR